MEWDVRSCKLPPSFVPCNGMEYYDLNWINSYSVLQSSTPVLVLRQYYSVLQITAPILKNIEITMYYFVLQSTTPVPPCTTKYHSYITPILLCTCPVLLNNYSSNALCHKVLLQHYPSLLQYDSSTTMAFCNTRSYKTYLPISSNTAPATQNTMLFTMHRLVKITFHFHEILRLPHKINVMIDPPHTETFIDNARKQIHLPNSPNAIPVTQNKLNN